MDPLGQEFGQSTVRTAHLCSGLGSELEDSKAGPTEHQLEQPKIGAGIIQAHSLTHLEPGLRRLKQLRAGTVGAPWASLCKFVICPNGPFSMVASDRWIFYITTWGFQGVCPERKSKLETILPFVILLLKSHSSNSVIVTDPEGKHGPHLAMEECQCLIVRRACDVGDISVDIDVGVGVSIFGN